MFSESRAQEFLALVLGVFTALSPLWVHTNARAAWTLVVLGVLIALAALAHMYRPEMSFAAYGVALFGLLLFLSPWIMRFTGYHGASWTAWIVGIITVVLAFAALPMIAGKMGGQSTRVGGPAHTHH